MGTFEVEQFLLETIQSLLGSKSSREFSEILTNRLKRFFSFETAGLYLYTPASDSMTPVSSFLKDPKSLGYQVTQLPPEGTIKLEAARSGSTLLCQDLFASEWTEKKILTEHMSACSLLVAPLQIQPRKDDAGSSRTLAVMFVAQPASHAFTEEQRQLLDRIARYIAPVLHMVLTGEERTVLRAISARLVLGTVTLEGIIPAVKDLIRQVIPHDQTCLVQFTNKEDSPWFDILYQEGNLIDLEQLRSFPIEQMAPTVMQRTGAPVLISGHQNKPFPEMAYFESIGIYSGMLLPLFVTKRLFGFLAIGSSRRHAFSEYDLGIAEQVGLHLSQAIANILAYEEIHALKEQLQRENTILREEQTPPINLREVVGTSPALQRTLKAIEQVAPTDSTVLITGETGTGKELVAQAIHRLSERRERPLFKMNCAALTPSLIESELFGHEKGAFTGAAQRKIGRFEVADGGTLFLDEVGEIPLELQAKLLRVLESQEIERIGGTTTLHLNVRVIAATNQNLLSAVQAGRFRADLYYRLKVFPIEIPPLRDRQGDVPMLAQHFVKKYSGQYRKSLTGITPDTLKALNSYSWPGNVRELQHVIERAVILSHETSLTHELLEPQISTRQVHDSSNEGTSLADAERTHILHALQETNWVLAGPNGAATRLGLKRSTLQHRMKKLGITRASS